MLLELYAEEEHTLKPDTSESAGVWPLLAWETLDSSLRKSWVVVWKPVEDMLV